MNHEMGAIRGEMRVQLNQKARSESKGKDFPLVVLEINPPTQTNSQPVLCVAFEVPPNDPRNVWYAIRPTGGFPYGAFECLQEWLEPVGRGEGGVGLCPKGSDAI